MFYFLLFYLFFFLIIISFYFHGGGKPGERICYKSESKMEPDRNLFVRRSKSRIQTVLLSGNFLFLSPVLFIYFFAQLPCLAH